MTHSGSVMVPFERNRIAIHWEGRPARDIIAFLFKNAVAFEPCAPVATFSLKEKNDRELWCYKNGELLVVGGAGKTALKLLDTVIHELAKPSDGGLLFHAAAVSRSGFGILLPGQSGSGKSSLSAWLVRHGYLYLTDEMVLIRSSAFEITGFLKPIHIKDPGIPGLEEFLAGKGRGGAEITKVGQGFLVDSICPGPGPTAPDTAVGMILFPKFKAGHPLELARISPANAGLHLMKSLINARNLPGHGFDRISLLSRKVPAYTLTYGSFSGISDRIDALITTNGSHSP